MFQDQFLNKWKHKFIPAKDLVPEFVKAINNPATKTKASCTKLPEQFSMHTILKLY